MTRPDITRSSDMQDPVSDLHLEVLHQVFIYRDCDSWLAAMPLDPKSAAGVDVDEGVELPLLRNHVPVAANATEVASGECEKKAHRKKFRLHKSYLVVGRRYRPFWIQKSWGDRGRGSEGVIVKSTLSVSSSST